MNAHVQDDRYAAASLLFDAAWRSADYLGGLGRRAVRPAPAAVAQLARLEMPMPETPSDPAAVLSELDALVAPATMATAGPRFFGFVIGGTLPAALAANWLATAWDQNAALASVTPGVARIEAIALRWLVDVLGLPASTEGAFVTGATMANFTALAAARQAVLGRAGWDVEADGLVRGPAGHGDGRRGSASNPAEVAGAARIRAPAHRAPAGRFAGSRARGRPAAPVGSGHRLPAGRQRQYRRVRPLRGDLPSAHERRVPGCTWTVHSGCGRRRPRGWRSSSRGVELADSWATDAHKWLNVPYDSGLAFVRESGALPAAMAISADYLPRAGAGRSPSDYTPELSRRARGVEVWAALRSLGRSGLAEMLERNCRQARRFAARLAAAGYQILNDVVLNQVLVSFGSPDATRRVIAAVQEDGTCWCGGTVWQGRAAMRISVCSWATTDADVELSVEAILRAARQAG